MKLPNYTFAVTMIFIISGLWSCSQDNAGYGVVVWGPDDSTYKTGSIVVIQKKRETISSLDVSPVDNPKMQPSRIETWRIQVFGNKGDAETFIKKNTQWLFKFAVCNKQALPVRSSADRQANTVYRLRVQETVKVLGRSESVTQENNVSDYWYEILTSAGVHGWAFGSGLLLFTSGDQPVTKSDTSFQPDQVIAKLTTTIWRPDSYRKMLSTNHYDLRELAPESGFFIDSMSKTIRISLANQTLDATWNAISGLDSGRFSFDGTGVTGRFLPDGSLELIWKDSNQNSTTSLFAPFPQDIGKIIASENASRSANLRRISFSGAELKSEAYGSLRIRTTTFDWIGANALPPNVLPPGAQGSGKIVQDVYLEAGAASAFQGVIGFLFSGTGPEKTVYFGYNTQAGVLNLTWLPSEGLKDLVFSSVPTAPVTISFIKGQ